MDAAHTVRRNMSRDEVSSPSLLDSLTYRCRYCRQEVKPEKQAGSTTLPNIVVIELDGSVRRACRKCANVGRKAQ